MVANRSQVPAASKLDNIPSMNTDGSSLKSSGGTIFSLIVVVTSAPAKYAPIKVKIDAITNA